MKKKIENLLIATRNQGKFNELKKLLDPYVKNIISLGSLNDFDEIEEDQKTYYGNSLKKAKHYYEKYLIPTLGDDSGIEIDALNGYPGINSARIESSDLKRNQLIIKKMITIKNRSACMYTVLVFYNKKPFSFTGKVCGEITNKIRGYNGFGYDSIFLIKKLNKTYGEMSYEEKTITSHRKIAIEKFIDKLRGNYDEEFN